MKTVSEVSRLTGISVRTLHHYDAIGLLKPTETTESGYRMYDDKALLRLHTILLFRELQFPLKDIRAIMDTPGFDPRKALDGQIELLEMKKKRIDEIISLARQIRETGGIPMDFSAFDNEKIAMPKRPRPAGAIPPPGRNTRKRRRAKAKRTFPAQART